LISPVLQALKIPFRRFESELFEKRAAVWNRVSKPPHYKRRSKRKRERQGGEIYSLTADGGRF